jgi:hypothetical protein
VPNNNVVLSPIYILAVDTLLSMILVMLLQIITALIFFNYFSASSVRKEMTIALYNMSRVINRIYELPTGQSINDDIYQKLRIESINAKRYEMSADDTLLVNFYRLTPNSTYLFSISQE